MISEVVLLVGVPKFSPGLLFKMFMDLPGVEAFYRPLTPNLDLISHYSTVLRGESGFPMGYFDSYERVLAGFKNYPENFENTSVLPLKEFLLDCQRTPAKTAVFELSGSELFLHELRSLWPKCKIVSLEENLVQSDINVKKLTLEGLYKDYVGSTRMVLDFCQVYNYPEESLCLNADWLKLHHFFEGFPSVSPPPFIGESLSRKNLKKFLEQRAAIIELAKQEPLIRSLETQLKNMHTVAEERLQIIQRLEKELLGQINESNDRIGLRRLTDYAAKRLNLFRPKQ